MKGTIRQFISGGDGSVTVTVHVAADPTDAAACAAFDEQMGARFEAFQAGDVSVELGLGSAAKAPAKASAEPHPAPLHAKPAAEAKHR
jgi:hypothetical protein